MRARLTDVAQQWIAGALAPGGCALDATAGTGRDTLFLAAAWVSVAVYMPSISSRRRWQHPPQGHRGRARPVSAPARLLPHPHL